MGLGYTRGHAGKVPGFEVGVGGCGPISHTPTGAELYALYPTLAMIQARQHNMH